MKYSQELIMQDFKKDIDDKIDELKKYLLQNYCKDDLARMFNKHFSREYAFNDYLFFNFYDVLHTANRECNFFSKNIDIYPHHYRVEFVISGLSQFIKEELFDEIKDLLENND